MCITFHFPMEWFEIFTTCTTNQCQCGHDQRVVRETAAFNVSGHINKDKIKLIGHFQVQFGQVQLH